MSRSGIQWKVLIEEVIEYEDAVEHSVYFEKLVSLWREYPNSIGNCVQTGVHIDENTDVFNEVVSEFERKFKFSPRNMMDLVVFKHVPDERRGSKVSQNGYEVSFFEEEHLARFYPVVLDEGLYPLVSFPYSIAIKTPSENRILLQFLAPVSADYQEKDRNSEYLTEVGFKVAAKWMKHLDVNKIIRKTHSLIDKESYVHFYRNLRETVGKPICQQWTENSDPHKAVFEDCGISTYIHHLVEAGVIPKFRKFVDIGCGNGLLVHLLNKIGYQGYGVDVRKRKCWATLFNDVDLRESSVNPQIVVNNEPHFDADVDLLIGNHSDELTPWIPVMAAKLNVNFFLIPCCPFNFFGKFENKGSFLGPKRVVSQYESFFEWTVTVAERLGYYISLDRMAIPSTKRMCIVGKIPATGLCPNFADTITLLTGGKEFVARPQEIKNRNCMDVPKPERDRIAMKLFKYVLNYSDEVKDGWRCGGAVPLQELASILTDEEKALMKDNDGGLQTFMRNHFQIFHVYQTNAHLRDFRQPYVPRNRNYRTKRNGPPTVNKAQCFMALYHPDGCPTTLSGTPCLYTHY